MIDLKYTLLGDPKDLDVLLDRIGKSQFVLLGESSHGTLEFYKWRIEISKRLIKEKEFSFVAVEGDWPDCFEVNKYVKGLSDTGQSPHKVPILLIDGPHGCGQIKKRLTSSDGLNHTMTVLIHTNRIKSDSMDWTFIACGNL